MSIEATLQRVLAIDHALADPAALFGAGGAATGGTQAPVATGEDAGEAPFAAALRQASATGQSASAGEPTTSAPLGGGGAYPPAGPGGNALSSAQSGAGGLSEVAVANPYTPQSLSATTGPAALSPAGPAGGGPFGARIVAIAESQLGQTEQPPGSNESPAIAQYRGATAGAVPGAPWCAYFASWVARQAGEPIGEGGQGAGAVGEIWAWAQSTGRAIPNGPGVVPKPGDLIVFGDEHVGIVRDVSPSGQIQTIEGNYENKVAANVRSPGEATGYVEMG